MSTNDGQHLGAEAVLSREASSTFPHKGLLDAGWLLVTFKLLPVITTTLTVGHGVVESPPIYI